MYSSDEQLKRKMENGEYPPRFTILCIKQTGALETLPSFVISKMLKNKEKVHIGRFLLDKNAAGMKLAHQYLATI